MKEQLSVRIDPELIKKLREKAEKENRPLSNLVETILFESLGGKK